MHSCAYSYDARSVGIDTLGRTSKAGLNGALLAIVAALAWLGLCGGSFPLGSFEGCSPADSFEGPSPVDSFEGSPRKDCVGHPSPVGSFEGAFPVESFDSATWTGVVALLDGVEGGGDESSELSDRTEADDASDFPRSSWKSRGTGLAGGFWPAGGLLKGLKTIT